MTIDYRIQIADDLTEENKENIAQLIMETFDHINQTFNKWNPESELSYLNRLKANKEVYLSDELYNFLLLIDKIVVLTENRFDPTIEPLQALWKKQLTLGKIPTNEEISQISKVIGWDKIHFADKKFSKDHDLTALDLGGIAKGYLVDILSEKLLAKDIKNFYVEWGGEIRASGLHPDNRPWRIFISHLGSTDPEKAIDILSLQDQAIATSGDYLQNWTLAENVSYFHVLDPKKGEPLQITEESIASVSVLASNCTLADALATALMMFSSKEEALVFSSELKAQYPDLQFWIISR